MPIVGTAGHVDHGKSALVRALTGVEPDRWAEERERGMTLDLGFAPLRFADGIEAGMIDVPGHERYLHNMLAGAAGMEIVVLVVAADEGPRPQTFEHLAILRYLDVRATIVAHTKIDRVPPAERDGAERRTRELLRGTIAEHAPLVAVSALDGEGIDALRDMLRGALDAAGERAPHAPAYLPIDRAFVLAGHGTVATGTLMQGVIAVGDTLRVWPAGRDARVRSLHVFGSERARVQGGNRVAIGLAGIERGALARGSVAGAAQLPAAQRIAVRFRPRDAALPMLRRRNTVRAYIGAAEELGTLVLARIPASPDDTVDARLDLREPAVAIPGMPFVVRRMSPMDLMGGGTIVGGATELHAVAQTGQEHAAIRAALAAAGTHGATGAEIATAVNRETAYVEAALAELAAAGDAIRLARPPGFLDATVAAGFAARVEAAVAQRHRERPWLAGLTTLALARALEADERDVLRLVTSSAAAAVQYRGGYVSAAGFIPRLRDDQQRIFDGVFPPTADGTADPVAAADLREHLRRHPGLDLETALETLLGAGLVRRIGETYYRADRIERIRAMLVEALRREGRITVARFRDLTGTSRKYAVPLLEYFDATGVTIRDGDLRALRQTPAARQPAVSDKSTSERGVIL